MARKILLTVALIVTACNLTVGIAYSAVCQSSGGARACGKECATQSDGSCGCTGECTKEERDWVAAAGKKDDEEELELVLE
jgi:hypothetical protein